MLEEYPEIRQIFVPWKAPETEIVAEPTVRSPLKETLTPDDEPVRVAVTFVSDIDPATLSASSVPLTVQF
jgi:hypothetical protein